MNETHGDWPYVSDSHFKSLPFTGTLHHYDCSVFNTPKNRRRKAAPAEVDKVAKIAKTDRKTCSRCRYVLEERELSLRSETTPETADRSNSPITLPTPHSSGTSTTAEMLNDEHFANFKPKDATEYTVHIEGRTLKKSRTHEALVNQFAEYAATKGFKVSTPHPRDLTLRRNGAEWLVEAKVLYQGNATDAVRATIGQLFTYRHFLYETSPEPKLLGLFSEDIGEAYVSLLKTLGIDVAYRSGDGWMVLPLWED